MSNLITRKDLLVKYPALGERKYRLDYLIKVRKMPIVKLGRRVYFDESEIQKWIEKHKIAQRDF